jgi:hypothetical protein
MGKNERKGICPQNTQMDADEEFLFRICDNRRDLRASPDSVAAGRTVFFCGHFLFGKTKAFVVVARILAFLAFLNFFFYSIDRFYICNPCNTLRCSLKLCLACFATALSSRKVFSVYPMNLPSKQTGLALLSRAFAVLLFFMGDFVF